MLHLAARLPEPHLGALDAIHLATALAADASELIGYDARRCEAADAEGLAVSSPARSAL